MVDEYICRYPEGFAEQLQETLKMIRFEDEMRKACVRQHWWQFWRPWELTYVARRMGL